MRADAAGLLAPTCPVATSVVTGTFQGEVDWPKVGKAGLELTILTLETKE